MKNLILLFMYLTSTSLFAATANNDLTYQELAKKLVMPHFNEMVEMLEDVTSKTKPHQAKDVRKRIGLVRSYIDVFSYSYKSKGNVDQFLVLRESLDEGYETIGHYKDLFDSQGIKLAKKSKETGEWSEGVKPSKVKYPKKATKKLLKSVLKWKKQFLSPATLKSTRKYLSKVSQKMAKRKKSDLSKNFWGGVSVKPKAEYTGLENVKRLMAAILTSSVMNYEEVLSIDDLTTHDNTEKFHDFRKKLRAVISMERLFPDLKGSSELTEYQEVLVELVSRYGDINDTLVKLESYQDGKKAEKLRNKIRDAWDLLIEWQLSVEIDVVIARYSMALFEDMGI